MRMTASLENSDIDFMKKYALLLAGLLICFSLAACDGLVKLTEEDGKLIDKKNGITYISAPICFEPAVLEEEPYARCKSLNREYYGLFGKPTTEWISEMFEGIGGLYYAEGAVTLPTLEEFEADQIVICEEKLITVGIGQVTEQEDIDRIIAAFVDGETVPSVQSGESFKLKFTSAKDEYDGIYYNLIYVEADDGENYIYDRSTKTCVNVGDVLQKYLPRTTES